MAEEEAHDANHLPSLMSCLMIHTDDQGRKDDKLDKGAVVSAHLLVYHAIGANKAQDIADPSAAEKQQTLSSIKDFKTTFLDGLQAISISELDVGVVHQGRVLFGTLCVDAFVLIGIMTVLQDEEEPSKAVRLAVYNTASAGSVCTLQLAQAMCPKGSRVAVKHPCLSVSRGGSQLVIRVDYPAHFAVLPLSASTQQCDSRPSPLISSPDAATMLAQIHRFKAKGNNHFQNENWNCARAMYTLCLALIEAMKITGIPVDDSRVTLSAYSNRAEIWLKLGACEKALSDSDSALAIAPRHLKSWFRKGRALYGLLRYEESFSCLEALVAQHPQNTEVQTFLAMAGKHALEPPFSLSDYLLRRVFAPACADYIGPVVVKHTGDDDRGRGLFASRNLKPGELLLVSNAIAACKLNSMLTTESLNGNNADRISNEAREELVAKLTSLSLRTPKQAHQLQSLAHSTSQRGMPCPSMGLFSPASETFHRNEALQLNEDRIRGIVTLNAFGSLASSASAPDKGVEALSFVGLWLLLSFINHSCAPNASCLPVGEAVFVHAASHIPAGQEITIPYFDPFHLLDHRELLCQRAGFHCSCKRCVAERPNRSHLQRWGSEFNAAFDSVAEERVSLELLQEFEKVFKSMKKKLNGMSSMTGREKEWVLAVYSKVCMAKWFCEGKGVDMSGGGGGWLETAVEMVEALRCCWPGRLVTLQMVGTLAMEAKSGKKGHVAKRLMEQARQECLCCFGKLKAGVLEQLLDGALFEFPYHGNVPNIFKFFKGV